MHELCSSFYIFLLTVSPHCYSVLPVKKSQHKGLNAVSKLGKYKQIKV